MTVSLDIKGLAELRARLDERRLRLAMSAAMKEIAPKIEADFNSITRTWEHDVKIEKLFDTSGESMSVMVGTDDKIFNMLERGTRAHEIWPRKAKALRFMSGFRPKTTPGGLQSGAGGSFGNVLFRPFVKHPGTKPRRWLPKIQNRLNKYGPRIVLKHIERWIARM